MNQAEKINGINDEERVCLRNLMRLYRAVFVLTCNIPAKDKLVLRNVHEIIINLNHTLYESFGIFEVRGFINLDFCQDFNELILLKCGDDGNDSTGWEEKFKTSIVNGLNEIENCLNLKYKS